MFCFVIIFLYKIRIKKEFLMNLKRYLPLLGLIFLVFVAGCTVTSKFNSGNQKIESFDVLDSSSKITSSSLVGASLADSIMTSYPSYLDYDTNVIKKGWEYTNGVILFGFIKLYEATGQHKYLDYVKPYADRYVQTDGTILYLMGDGVSTRDKRILDVIQPSTLLFELFTDNANSSQYLIGMKNTRNIFPTIQKNSLGGFFHKPTYQYQMWLDGTYMALPFITRYGDRYANKFDPTGADKKACYDTAAYQLKLIASKTMDLSQSTPAGKIPVHAWLDWNGLNAYNAANPTATIAAPTWANASSGKSPEKWGRATAWYTMALVDVLEYLPRDHADYQSIKDILKTIAEGLKASQDPATGLWYQVVDKVPKSDGTYSDNWVETSASAIFVYSLKKASVKGYIATEYADVAQKGWAGVMSKVIISGSTVTVKGTVGGMGVLDNYAAYIAKSSAVADNVPHGIAGVLMAASVMEY
jgi:unsaturated rhamnogalacturonyl hydrolase